MEPRYPFTPKSTRLLRRGQFWALPLANGRFGAACVAGVHLSNGKASTRAFIAGVINWVGTSPPTATDLECRPLTKYAFAHVKTITENCGEILGLANIDLTGIPEAAESLSLPTWGFHVPTLLAAKLNEPK